MNIQSKKKIEELHGKTIQEFLVVKPVQPLLFPAGNNEAVLLLLVLGYRDTRVLKKGV